METNLEIDSKFYSFFVLLFFYWTDRFDGVEEIDFSASFRRINWDEEKTKHLWLLDLSGPRFPALL